jgi:hypothetical protein
MTVLLRLFVLHVTVLLYFLFQQIKFTLVTVSNGGTLGLRKVFTLSILPNDNPHGVVQFTQTIYTVQEKDIDTVQTLSLTRS